MLDNPTSLLEQECRALRTRLGLVRPLVLHEAMLPAAALTPVAMLAVEGFLIAGRRELRDRIDRYLDWLTGPGARAGAAEQQRRYASLRWRFNEVLAQFDTFQLAVTQRSESQIGVWMSGLDVAAVDAMHLPVAGWSPPPVICYLDRGRGGAIRRARTRLAGDPSPIAVIRIPRERMVGHGVASTLTHEVGHQVAALLGLVDRARAALRHRADRARPAEREAWLWFARWSGEIIADLWAVAQVGVAASLGLLGIVSLPAVFVFRISVEDPHPIPWIRLHLSCALGQAIHPHQQWDQLSRTWDQLYPTTSLAAGPRDLLQTARALCPSVAELLVSLPLHPADGVPTRALRFVRQRAPDTLLADYDRLGGDPAELSRRRPCTTFALLGQARAAGRLTPEDESRVVDDVLTRWALDSTLDAFRAASAPARYPVPSALPIH